MIPQNVITREHVLTAIAQIDQEGVPDQRQATGFDLVYNGKAYPPKYVISLAVKAATGEELDSGGFSGGPPTNGLLQDLGFEIVERAKHSIREKQVTANDAG